MLRLRPGSTLFPYTTLFRSNAVAADFGWSFTTGATPDTTPPTVSFTVPASGATAVAINQTVNATFSEAMRSEEHTSELQSLRHLVCRLLLEKKTTEEDRQRH